MIIEGDVPDQALKEAWNHIFLQYCELIQDGAYNELLDKTISLQEANGRIAFLDGSVMYLQATYDPTVIKLINEMAIPLKLSPDENPIPKLKIVQGYIKRRIFDRDRLEKDVVELQTKNTDAVTIDYFDEWLSIMSKHMGYAVLAKDITVRQFVRNQKRVNENAARQNKADNVGR